MKTKNNIELIRARYRAVNAHDLDTFQKFYAGSVLWTDPALTRPIKGPSGVRKRLETLITAFPDLHWKLDQIFSQGAYVCAQFTFLGTHRGTLRGRRGNELFPPSNKRIRIEACGVYVVRRLKIVDSRIYFDFDSFRAQIQRKLA
jgi:steroid delta-isomerase-like uncharacterized protein